MCRDDVRVACRGLPGILLLLVLLDLYPAVASGQGAGVGNAPVVLEIGEPYGHATITEYEFAAESGHAYLVRIESTAGSVSPGLTGPDGAGMELEFRRQERNLDGGVFRAVRAGTHRLVPVAELQLSGDVPTIVSVTDLGPEFAIESTSIEGWWLFAEAMVEYWIKGDWDTASETAAIAAGNFAAAGDERNEANSLLLRARALTETLHRPQDSAATLAEIASLLDQSYNVFDRLGDVRGKGDVRRFNALSNLNAGDYDAARPYYTEAAELYEQVDDWEGARYLRLDLGVLEIHTGNSLRAVDELQALLDEEEIRRPDPTVSDLMFRAAALDQLGAAHSIAGNIDDAQLAFDRALAFHRQSGDVHGEAETLNGIAGVYIRIGDLEGAESFLELARAAAARASNGRAGRSAETASGNVAYWRGEFESAIDHYDTALEQTESEALTAYRETLLARAYIAVGKFEQASELVSEALEIAQRNKSPRTEADAELQLGMSQLGLGRPDSAIESLEGALSAYETLAFSEGQADAANALAQSYQRLAAERPDTERMRRELDSAIERSNQALDHVDRMVSKSSAPGLRAHYAAKRRGYFQTNVELKLARGEIDPDGRQNLIADALMVSERARARRTLDLLNEASVDLYRKINPALAAERAALIAELGRKESERDGLLASERMNSQLQERVAAFALDVSSIKDRLEVIEIEIRRDNERFGALTSPDPNSFAEVQALLGPETVVLQYLLGEPQSYVWVVTDDTVSVERLAGRQEIESAVRLAAAEVRARDATFEDRRNREARIEAASRLVIDPVAVRLDRGELIVIADGALNYLPFQLLVSGDGDNRRRLIDDREIVMLPSLSVLAALRERSSHVSPKNLLAAYADPVFSVTDPRLRPEHRRSPEIAPAQAENRWQSRFDKTRAGQADRLDRLEGTAQEAEDIAALVTDGTPLVLTGFDASKQNIVDRDLSQYRYLHFATHGLVDAETPALSSLVFSRFDERGTKRDEYLQVHDIYGLDLNADLVVLSACGTGLGEDIDGEGLLGLTQAFLYAGARSLVVSLWDVPDRATAELMKRFYTEIITNGQSPAKALRKAQLAIEQERRWSDPFYWGAFVLLGDWEIGTDAT